MALNSILYNPAAVRIILLLVGGVLFIIALLLRRYRRIRAMQAAGFQQGADESQPSASDSPHLQSAAAETTTPPPLQLRFETIAERPSFLMDILRISLILLCFVIAAAWILIALPQSAVDRIAARLLPRNVALVPQEKIALLYLGDETKDKEFTIRGVIRNISSEPLENLDAIFRMYGPDGSVTDTAIVRMDFESIAPGTTAQFHLTYHDYQQQFSSYVIDFKSRQGDAVPYADLRTARAGS